MLYTKAFREYILLKPIENGADNLKIISDYATHTMASWHMKEIETRYKHPINIELVVGMSMFDGISISVHEGFQNIVNGVQIKNLSKLTCQYVYEGTPVHSKLYLWEKKGVPFCAFMGSANYTQTAFSSLVRPDLMTKCDPSEALSYFETIEPNTIYCNHAEVEDHITFTQSHPVLESENAPLISLRGSDIQSINLSLLSRTGETGEKSGLNWGQRDKREPNQAYIPLPVDKDALGFFH